MLKLSTLIDLLTIAGVVLIAVGLYLYSHPLLFVIGGLLSIGAARALARAESEHKKQDGVGG
jgi:hypothetical protein